MLDDNKSTDAIYITISYIENLRIRHIFATDEYYFKVKFGKQETATNKYKNNGTKIYIEQEFSFLPYGNAILELILYRCSSFGDYMVGNVEGVPLNYIKEKVKFREWKTIEANGNKRSNGQVLVYFTYKKPNTDIGPVLNKNELEILSKLNTYEQKPVQRKCTSKENDKVFEPKKEDRIPLYNNDRHPTIKSIPLKTNIFQSPGKFNYPSISNYNRLYMRAHFSNGTPTNNIPKPKQPSIQNDLAKTQTLLPPYSDLISASTLVQPHHTNESSNSEIMGKGFDNRPNQI